MTTPQNFWKQENEWEHQAKLDRIMLPTTGSVMVSATSGSVQHMDLAGLSSATTYKQHMLSIISDVDIIFHCSDGATDSVSETAVSGSTQGFFLPGNVQKDGYAVGRYLHFVNKSGATDGYIRVTLS